MAWRFLILGIVLIVGCYFSPATALGHSYFIYTEFFGQISGYRLKALFYTKIRKSFAIFNF